MPVILRIVQSIQHSNVAKHLSTYVYLDENARAGYAVFVESLRLRDSKRMKLVGELISKLRLYGKI